MHLPKSTHLFKKNIKVNGGILMDPTTAVALIGLGGGTIAGMLIKYELSHRTLAGVALLLLAAMATWPYCEKAANAAQRNNDAFTARLATTQNGLSDFHACYVQRDDRNSTELNALRHQVERLHCHIAQQSADGALNSPNSGDAKK